MKILYFSPIMWDDLKQRPQHLAEELAKVHKIYYIEPTVSIVNSLLNGNELYKPRSIKINDNLTVLRPNGKFRLPTSLFFIDFFKLNERYINKQINKLIDDCDVIWLGSPIYYSLIKDRYDKKIVYDKMDDFTVLTNNLFMKEFINRNESHLIKQAAIIFTTTKTFYESIKMINNHTYIIHNGVCNNFEIVSNSNNSKVIEDIKKLQCEGKKIFGYVGTIDHWFDFEVIKHIVNFDKNYHVFIVGKNNLPEINNPNIHYYKPVLKEELLLIISYFDYCLYPFKADNFADTIDPVKIYEYLSLNKKVISVYTKETERFKDYINFYSNHSELINLLANLREIKKPFNNKTLLEDFINKNCWSERAKTINNLLKNMIVN